MNELNNSIAVLGAGAWGATIAWLLAGDGRDVRLWGRSRKKVEALRKSRVHSQPNEIEFPSSCLITDSLEEALSDVEVIVVAVNSQAMKVAAEMIAQFYGNADKLPRIVSAAKGLEAKSLRRMSEVINESLPRAKVLSLSGPNLAFEIRSGLPSASTVAADEIEVAREVQKLLSTKTFRVYASDDLKGVELGGTLKNVIAIAAGVSDGLNLGVNAKSALLTRGLKEMVRLSSSLGARESTLFGLSGMGDLIATCQGPLSRNYRVGLYLAENLSLDEAIKKVGALAEGVETTHAVCELSKKVSIDLPIAFQVQSTLKGITTPEKSIMALMQRPLAQE